jgi:hypothetical protein
MPKRDYYCQSRRGNRLFELGLSDVALALCAASSKTDQSAIARLFAEHGRAGFLAAWLRHRDVGWAADLIRRSPKRRKTMTLPHPRGPALRRAARRPWRSPMLATPAHAQWTVFDRPTMRRTC